jgi:uncharacterized small protein (DUF1192 family)
MDIDDRPKPKPVLTIGENLDTISVAELQERVLRLEEEIARVKTEIQRKTASKAAADSFFKI